jgi:hypothetical protein
MKQMVIITGCRASGKSFIAQALKEKNIECGETAVIFDPISSLNEVNMALAKVPDDTIGIFVCGPNFTFEPRDLVQLNDFMPCYAINVDRFVHR